MKHQHQRIVKFGRTIAILGLALVAVLTSAVSASAQTTIAKWTFENLTIGAGSTLTNFSNGRSVTNILPEIGSGNASCSHPGSPAFGAGTWGTVTGNGSSKALTSAGWTNNPNATSGDYYQFAVSTLGYTNISLSFDETGSASGPGKFYVAYSTDGVNFTQFGSIYTVANVSWNATTPNATSALSFDFSSITALANAPIVYLRLVDANNTSVSGGTVGTGGTSRIDNVVVAGTIAGPPQIIVQPASSTNFFGDTVNLTVTAGGDAPLSYQWYTNSTPLAPLTDGGSGFGSGTISGSTAATLTLTFVNTNQTGDYRVVASNPLGSITSSVVHVQINARAAIVTNIAYLHTLHDANYALTDTTNLYQVTGIVTTIGNLVSGTTEVESFFVQDSTGGMDVFFRGGFPFPATGDRVRITAPLLQFQGVLEAAPVNGNPAHSIEILSSANPLPAPQYFNFTTLPTAVTMEESIEGRYLVVSNVFLGITNANQSAQLVGNQLISMTNSTGQIFKMIVANNPALGPIGTSLPGFYAKSVVGVMSQAQTSGTVLTNNYSIILSDYSQIEFATPPINPIPLSFTSSLGSITLNWADASFSLQMSTNVAGPYSTISGAVSPFTTNTTGNAQMFFRLIQ